MRLVDFLIQLLEAHAQTLHRLAALLGEDVLIELLEQAGEEADDMNLFTRTADGPPRLRLATALEEAAVDSPQSPYVELEGAVQDMRLSAMLQFHLWAYPHYRAFIESPVDLNSRIRGAGSEVGAQLVNEALERAKEWVRKLPLPTQIGLQAESAAEVPWLRFRANVLKRIGKRPMGPVY